MARYKRHSAEVTSDRLIVAYEKWYPLFDGYELDAISMVRQALEEIADGTRGGVEGRGENR